MVEEFPTNSRRAREEPKADEKKKQVRRVVSSDVVRRRKPLGKRFAEVFIGGDTKGVAQYVVQDVLIPAAKDMVSDAVSQGIERMLFGDVRGRSGGSRAPRSSGTNGYVSYNRFGGTARREPEPRREMSRQARATHDFDEVVLQTKAEADEVISQLFELVSEYGMATVADLYDMIGQSGNFTDESWGWTDLRGAGVTRIKGGYLLDLPRTTPLDHN